MFPEVRREDAAVLNPTDVRKCVEISEDTADSQTESAICGRDGGRGTSGPVGEIARANSER